MNSTTTAGTSPRQVTRWLLALALLLATLGAGGTWDLPRTQASTAAQRPSGIIATWGYDQFGKLGDDAALVSKSTPVQVAGLTDIIDMDSSNHSIALKADGTVWTWGFDQSGQLGDDAALVDKPTPVQVAGLSDVIDVDAGYGHNLVLKANGTVWAWGGDGDGQLGDDAALVNKSAPVQVAGLSDVIAISAGSVSMALTAVGTVWTWGNDLGGMLGDDAALVNKPTPVKVMGLGNIVAVESGSYQSLALRADGTVWAWGRDFSGGLGDDAALVDKPTPVQVAGLTDVTAITAGGEHSLALMADGTVRSWGLDLKGQLGDDAALVDKPTPVQVAGLTGVIAIASGYHNSLALLSDGTVRSWGWDYHGEVGDDAALVDQPIPVAVAGLTGVFAIANGITHSMALREAPSMFTLNLTTVGSGSVERSPAGTGSGPFSYAPGAVVTLTSQAGVGNQFTPTPPPGGSTGQLFIGWTVDGVNRGWASPLTITMNANHTVQATFAPLVTFGLDTQRPDYVAITRLAARGTIRGYADGTYGPDDGVQRAQMAAFIARAMPAGPDTPNTMLTPPACLAAGSWDCEEWGNNFSDRNGLDGNLWRNVGALQHYNVAKGYDGAACAARGASSPCFAPVAPVSYVETVVFITRAMIAKGYWQLQSGAPQPYAGVPAVFAPEVATYHFYTASAGGIPAPPSDWNAGATRGWFARVLWQALNTYWGTDGNLPDGNPGGGNAP